LFCCRGSVKSLIRPQSLGCGISSFCCTVCSLSPASVGDLRSALKFQNIRVFLPISGGALPRPFANSPPPTKPLPLNACAPRLTPGHSNPSQPQESQST